MPHMGIDELRGDRANDLRAEQRRTGRRIVAVAGARPTTVRRCPRRRRGVRMGHPGARRRRPIGRRRERGFDRGDRRSRADGRSRAGVGDRKRSGNAGGRRRAGRPGSVVGRTANRLWKRGPEWYQQRRDERSDVEQRAARRCSGDGSGDRSACRTGGSSTADVGGIGARHRAPVRGVAADKRGSVSGIPQAGKGISAKRAPISIGEFTPDIACNCSELDAGIGHQAGTVLDRIFGTKPRSDWGCELSGRGAGIRLADDLRGAATGAGASSQGASSRGCSCERAGRELERRGAGRRGRPLHRLRLRPGSPG
jgi:hypothetical protein